MSSGHVDTTIKTAVLANTVFDAVLDATAINAWYTEVAAKIDGNYDEAHADNVAAIGLYRQAIINGNFDVWQRGTSFTGNNIYTADRWYESISATAATITNSRQSFTFGQTAVPNNPKYFMRINPTVLTGCSYFVEEQRIEGVDKFAGQTLTVSFWMKADTAQTISAFLRQNFGTGGTHSSDVQVTGSNIVLSTTWTKYTVTLILPSISGKTLGSNANDYVALGFNLPLTGSYIVDIAQVQLNAGSISLPFQPRSFAEELSLCQRYYEKSYDQAVQAGASTISGVSSIGFGLDTATLAGCRFSTKKRVTPTVTIYSQIGTINKATISGGADTAAATAGTVGDSGFATVNSSGIVITSYYYYHWTADAEL